MGAVGERASANLGSRMALRTALHALALGALIVVAVVVYNTATFTSHQLKDVIPHPPPKLAHTRQELLHIAQEAIRLPTISFDDRSCVEEYLLELHALMERSFPLVHAHLRRDVINDLSLLYHWKGSVGDKNILLMAHMDVVPVPEDTVSRWSHDPFGGHIDEEFIWGRGTMDDKLSLIGILESAEALLEAGWAPTHDIYFAFGHDEEVLGEKGAKHIAEELERRKVHFEFIIDEGMGVIDGMLPVSQPVAMIATAEKGIASVILTLEYEGGHSSMPPPTSTIGIMADVVRRIENNPFPSRYSDGPSKQTLLHLAAEVHPLLRPIVTNMWLFEPLITYAMSMVPSMNSGVRTTTAVTMFNAGVKSNVLPQSARVTVNHRVMPGDSLEYVMEYDKKSANDPRIQFEFMEAVEASPLSDPHSRAFATVERSIREVMPDVLTAPGLMIASTDTKWFWNLSENIFRFQPLRMVKSDLVRFHGVDERVGIENFFEVIAFYHRLMMNAQQL